MGSFGMRRALLLGLLALLACLALGTASTPAADPEEVDDGTSEDGDDSSSGSASGSDSDSGSGSGSGKCPTDGKSPEECSGNGVCEPAEDDGFQCSCKAGYHGEDCSKLDDEFDVYFNRLMAQSKGQSAGGKVALMDSKLGSWNTRIKTMQKRFQTEYDDVHRYVDSVVAIQNGFLDKKEEAVDRHKAAVDALQNEVNTMKDAGHQEIENHVEALRQAAQVKQDALAQKEANINAEKIELTKTVTKGNTLGEYSRFNRMVNQWQLCDINPGHKDCQKKAEVKKPGVHIVVETKNMGRFYPSALAADEKAGASAGATAGVHLKSKQKK